MMLKNDFIAAYQWMFGSTKEQAKLAYKASDKVQIEAIINAWKAQMKSAFYND